MRILPRRMRILPQRSKFRRREEIVQQYAACLLYCQVHNANLFIYYLISIEESSNGRVEFQ